MAAVPKEILQSLMDNPSYGAAAKAIREHFDPLWGIDTAGQEGVYRVSLERVEEQEVTVFARTKAEAKELALEKVEKEQGINFHADWTVSFSSKVSDDGEMFQ